MLHQICASAFLLEDIAESEEKWLMPEGKKRAKSRKKVYEKVVKHIVSRGVTMTFHFMPYIPQSHARFHVMIVIFYKPYGPKNCCTQCMQFE